MNGVLHLLQAAELPSDDKFSAGAIGAVFFVLMAVAVILLWRNMTSRLKRLDDKYDKNEK